MALPECKRIEFDDEAGRAKLLAEGWREIEVLEKFEGRFQPSGVDAKHATHIARWWEMPHLVMTAWWSFQHDRLHQDAAVANWRASLKKVYWLLHAWLTGNMAVIASSWREGRGALLVIVSHREPGGFVIAMIAVPESARRKNVAGAMVRAEVTRLCEFLGKPDVVVSAGTQSTNEPAKALYRSLGMEVVRRQRTFHR